MKRKETRSLLVCLLLSYSIGFGQSGVDMDMVTDSTVVTADPEAVIDVGYETWQLDQSAFALESRSAAHFNQGLISDPSLLIQGKMAGVQVYNRGGDPNVWSLIRVRGLSALSQRQPLIVIDGMPGAALENLDPNDVGSITVLKDGSAQALYGIRASNGVVLITTKAATKHKLSISYTGQAASSQAYQSIPVLNANDFLNAGGQNFGSSTVWMDEVQRTGFSQTHHLAVQGSKANIDYRISGNYRNVEGVLQKSGFEQVNLRANLSTSLWRDKLSVKVSTAFTDRNSQMGFQEAFRYAVSYNPTAPVFAEDFFLPFNTTQYGGYFESFGLFDAFNPKALVDLNDRNRLNQIFNGIALLQYDVSPALKLNFRYAYQDEFTNERAVYSPQSLFRGNAFSPRDSLRGRADLYNRDQQLSLYELFANYHKRLGNSTFNITVGTSYTDGSTKELGYDLYGFTNAELAETKRLDSYNNWLDEASSLDTLSNGWATKYSAFFGRLHWSVGDQFSLHASVRSEGSSRLGSDNKWGAFPAFGMAYDFSKNSQTFDLFKLRLGYGVTGAVPDQAGVASQKERINIAADGTVTSNIVRGANPNLGWEEKREFNLGLDVRTDRLQAYVEWYTREVSDWAEFSFISFPSQFVNQHALRSRGLELGMDALVWNAPQGQYQMGLRLATYRSYYEDLDGELRQLSNSCCATANPVIVGSEGEHVGDLLAPAFVGANQQIGDAVFEDLNGDGWINLEVDGAYGPESDLAVAGNGLPSVELGWNHQLRLQNWEVNAFFRATFGHSLVNRFRQRHEVRPDFRSQYNFVATELLEEGLAISRYSDLYVEKADFLKLDYLTLARTFALGNNPDVRRLRVSLTAQNILLASSYTGADPEPSFEDSGSTDNGGLINTSFRNPLTPGIDRRTNYLPAQTYMLGINLSF